MSPPRDDTDEPHPLDFGTGDMDLEKDNIAELFMDDEEQENQMVDAFLLAGADYKRTKAHVKSVFNVVKRLPDSEETTFMELYGGGSICKEANLNRRNLNLVGLNALDLRTTKEDGSHWDFTKREDRRLARSMVDAEPHLAWGTLP